MHPCHPRLPVATAFVVLLVLACSDAGTEPTPVSAIVMISDGCGYNQIAATNLFMTGEPVAQPYERFPVVLAMQTSPAGKKGYDPAAAWTDFDYVRRHATDSAAAATAMATGTKTENGALGVDPEGNPLTNVLEVAESLGKATGVVTTVQFSHATPAGFVVHSKSRNDYEEIARQMLERSAVDVIMGCGHPWYDDDGRRTDRPQGYRYVGGEEMWQALVAGQAGLTVDADHDGALDDPWRLIEDRADFLALATEPSGGRVLGLARAHSTLQCRRSGPAAAAPFATPFNPGVPTLAEMTRAALAILGSDPDGFVLMVEGGAVDWACHENRADRLIEEEHDFAQAVQAALAWVDEHGRAAHTLIVITGDHETGYLTRAATGTDDTPWAHEPLVSRGQGQVPGLQWNSGSHTNSLVPLFARGPMAEQFLDRIAGVDPHRGPFVDNTAVAQVVLACLRAAP